LGRHVLGEDIKERGEGEKRRLAEREESAKGRGHMVVEKTLSRSPIIKSRGDRRGEKGRGKKKRQPPQVDRSCHRMRKEGRPKLGEKYEKKSPRGARHQKRGDATGEVTVRGTLFQKGDLLLGTYRQVRIPKQRSELERKRERTLKKEKENL